MPLCTTIEMEASSFVNICRPLPLIRNTLLSVGRDQLQSSGVFSDVYRAHWNGLSEVAIKFFRVVAKNELEEQKIATRLYREVKDWKGLNNPHVLSFSGLFRDPERGLAMVSPWMEHGNVMKYLRGFPNTNRLQLLSDVASGMAYLHSRAVVHGNLKGSNILVDSSGKAIISDFGLVCIQERIGEQASFDMVPSTRWMAPELLHDGQLRVTSASDIYSFGSLCLEMYTERPPFYNILSEFDVIFTVSNHEHPARPPLTHPATLHGLDDRMWALMMECWNASAGERPTSHTLCHSLTVMNMFTHPPATETTIADTQVKTAKGGDQVSAVNVDMFAASFAELNHPSRL